MNKFVLSAALAAVVASSLLSHAVCAADSNPLDNFYVAGSFGQSQYRADAKHADSVFQNLRFGWRWNGIFGPEIGYAYLGRRRDVNSSGGFRYKTSVNARAATFGISGKYNFGQNWFFTGHAGYLRSHRSLDDLGYDSGNTLATHKSWNNGWYGGVGVGYDLTKNVSIGVNYDNYHLQYGHDGGFRSKVNVAAFSSSIEYRF